MGRVQGRLLVLLVLWISVTFALGVGSANSAELRLDSAQADLAKLSRQVEEKASLQAIDQVVDVISGDPFLATRLLQGDWTVINEVLAQIEIKLDLGTLAEKPIVAYNADCAPEQFPLVCVTLWFFFTEPQATCGNFAINGDIFVQGNIGERSVQWRNRREPDGSVKPAPCQETSLLPCEIQGEEKACGLEEFTTIIDELFQVTSQVSNGDRGCEGYTFDEDNGDKLREEYIWEVVVDLLYIECNLPVQAVTSAQELLTGIIEPALPENGTPGNLKVSGEMNIELKQLAVSPEDFSRRSPVYSKPVPDGCIRIFNKSRADECQAKTDPYCSPWIDGPSATCFNPILEFATLTFLFTDLDPVTTNLFGFEFKIQELTADVNEEINGKKKELAQEPIEILLREALFNASSAVGDLLGNFSDSENGTYDLKPQRSVRVLPSVALAPERSLRPNPDLNLLVDIGNNIIVDTLGFFPGNSAYLSGDDPSAESPLGTIYDFLTDETIVVNEDADPVLGVIDSFLGTQLASKPRGSAHTIDLIAVATELLGEEEVIPGKGYSVEFGFALVEEKGNVVNITFDIPRATISINPRADAFISDRLNYLDRLFLIGPQTLGIPPIDGFDFTLDVSFDVSLAFFGGDRLVDDADTDPNEEPELVDQLLASLVPFTDGEQLRFQITWLDFFAEAAALLAIDENLVRALEIGPLTENIFDCLWSTWFETPQLAALALNSGGTQMLLSDRTPSATSGLFYLVQVAVNDISPMFVGLVPQVLSDLARDELVGTQFLDDTTCPKARESPGKLFQFSGNFVDDIRDLVNEENVAAVAGALFPKGDTPDREAWNQIIAEPLPVFELDGLPSKNGLEVTFEFIISRLEVQGIDPANFTAFTFLDINASKTDDYPYGLYSELGIGVPSNPLRLAIEVEINITPDRVFRRRALLVDDDTTDGVDKLDNSDDFVATWDTSALENVQGLSLGHGEPRKLQYGAPSVAPTSYPTFVATNYPTAAPTEKQPTNAPSVSPTSRPTGTPTTPKPTPLPYGFQINKLRLEASFENVYAWLDLLFKFYEYDIVSTRLENVLDVWCWLGKLQPYSGVKDLAVQLVKGDMEFTCIQCSNPIMFELQEAFTNDKADEEFFKLVNEVLDLLATILENFFTEENWETSLTDIRRWCEGLDSLERTEEFEPLKEDLTTTFGILGAATLLLGGLAWINCTCLTSTHKDDKHSTKPARKGEKKVEDPAAFLEDADNFDHVSYQLEHTPLFNHPSVPAFWRVAVPALFVLNLGLFLIGHVGQAVTTSLFASIAGVPIELEDFRSISVIQSAEAVWASGGYFLAILIVAMSIMWPYIKIIGMSLAWFAPTHVMSFHARGTLIKRLDQLGKWSLIELFLLLFVFISFGLEINSPEYNFLPGGFYSLALTINPQLSIYTFCTALVVSLATSNVIGWWHEHIEKQLATIYRVPQALDDVHMSVIEFNFPTINGRTLGITNIGTLILVISIILAIVLSVVAAAMPVLGTEVVGLAAFVIELEPKDTKQEFSLFRFFLIIFGGGDLGEMYLGIFFALTVIIFPVLQLVLLLRLLVGRFKLEQAIFWYDINVILAAWSCSEVFLVGVGVTVMELGQISGNLVKEECQFLQPIMKNQLEPIGLIDSTDVSASCFALLGSIEQGLFILFLAIVLANIAHYFVTVAFLKFIQARLQLNQGKTSTSRIITKLELSLINGGCLTSTTKGVDQITV